MALGCSRRCAELERFLTSIGIRPVLKTSPDDPILLCLDGKSADLILLEIHEDTDAQAPWLELLMTEARLPILFQDADDPLPSQRAAQERFASKIASVAERGWSARDTMPSPGEAARWVWVLGASVGGPQAVKAFLRHLPPSLPVAFILVQHIGPRFIEPLIQQISSVTPLQVSRAIQGMLLQHGQVIVAPVEKRIVIQDGKLALYPMPPDMPYRPSIDDVILQVAVNYGPHGGAIIFSGMGDDGVKGCLELAARGGTVWAQDGESCLVSNMPDRVRETGVVSFSGSPQALAARLTRLFKETRHDRNIARHP